jgi:hypothetical protein
MKTKDRLTQALIESNAPIAMIELARDGQYDDYESDSATPQLNLIRDCQIFGLQALKARVMNDEFAGTKEESDAWFEREGKHLLTDKERG